MDEILPQTFKASIAFGSIIISYFFGEWSVLLAALFFFVVFDVLTGLSAAAYQGRVRARVMFWAGPKKLMILGIIALAYQIDQVYVHLMDNPLSFGEFQISATSATILYYLVHEFLSINENLAKMGIPIPAPLKKAIQLFDNKEFKNRKDD